MVNACSLDRTEQAKRLEEIAALASGSLLEAKKTVRGAFLRLEDGQGVQTELRRLIAAESECCPFLRFEMRVTNGEVLLDVSGPADARPLIDELFAFGKAA